MPPQGQSFEPVTFQLKNNRFSIGIPQLFNRILEFYNRYGQQRFEFDINGQKKAKDKFL